MRVCRYIENNRGNKIFEGEIVLLKGIRRYDGKKYKPVKGKLIKIVDDNHILLRYYDGEEVLYNLNHVTNIF